MNPAAKLVIGILGFVVCAATLTICIVAVLTRDLTVVEKIATFALGNVSGVLAKVGFDAAKSAVGPVENATVTVNPENPA